jgi:hypothetical protein
VCENGRPAAHPGWLETAAREHSGFIIHVAWDPRFASFKNEPAFRELLRRMSLPEHQV